MSNYRVGAEIYTTNNGLHGRIEMWQCAAAKGCPTAYTHRSANQTRTCTTLAFRNRVVMSPGRDRTKRVSQCGIYAHFYKHVIAQTRITINTIRSSKRHTRLTAARVHSSARRRGVDRSCTVGYYYVTGAQMEQRAQ